MAYKTHRFSKSTFPNDAPDKMYYGGKGAGLIMMCQAGMPIPPGFVIPTDQCKDFQKQTVGNTAEAWLDGLMVPVQEDMKWLQGHFGYTPLVSVRSGAPVSMPGMMDTILNVGICDSNLADWSKRLGERTALDSYRRLIQMLGATAYNVPMQLFDDILIATRNLCGVTHDHELNAPELSELIVQYKKVFHAYTGQDFPQHPHEQLKAAIAAVFNSWFNERAVTYREMNKISEDMATAVNVQAMVFGNMNDASGTGVLFTRDPSTGENTLMGEFLQNAQGEDVVAGIRTPVHIDQMASLSVRWEGIRNEIDVLCDRLEDMYKDMVDIEFTVQDGTLFILQSRNGKRSAQAAFKIACDLFHEGVIDVSGALSRLTRQQFKIVRRPMIDPKFKLAAHFEGLPACPGITTGRPVFSAKDAVDSKDPCILVTHETNPNDIAGMAAAVGILTKTGGATSHAAVVARAMDKACVVGCTDLDFAAIKKAKQITIDGSTGRVWLDTEVAVIDGSNNPEVIQVMNWCMEEGDFALLTPAVDEETSRPQQICAYHWWGDTEILDTVLTEIRDYPSELLNRLSLDVRMPAELVPSTDAVLEHAFGFKGDNGFYSTLMTNLLVKPIKGLTIVGATGSAADNLREHGYKTSSEAKSLADVLNGGVPTPTLLNSFGSEEARDFILEALKAKGVKPHSVRKAAPPEYATFQVLSA